MRMLALGIDLDEITEIEDGEIPDEETTKEVKVHTLGGGLSPDFTKDLKHDSKQLGTQTKKKTKCSSQKKCVIVGKESIDDDWASDVEKAIRAVMDRKSKSGLEDKSIGDDSERKAKKKKKKRRHHEDDDEDRRSKKRKQSHGHSKESTENVLKKSRIQPGGNDQDEDDDEMLFVRGASPILRKESASPSNIFHDEAYDFGEGGNVDDPYDSFYENSDLEVDEFKQSQQGKDFRSKRGGRGMRRPVRIRGGGRGLMSKRLHGGRKEMLENKGNRIGMKRRQLQHQRTMSIQESRLGTDSVCLFFMQGKCQKGDDCPYSHDAHPPRKMELCKFYLMDCCAKKDKCLYMHSDFPCKFYHTGMKCYAGSRCKFSHGSLNETTRSVLLKHLETAPKEILGDFPRLSREGAAAMVSTKKKLGHKGAGTGNRKIPSLFEIEIPIPPQLLSGKSADERSPTRRSTPMPDSENEDQDRCSTPMPSSPKLEKQSFSCRSSKRLWDTDDDRPDNLDFDKKASAGISRNHSIDSNEERLESKSRFSPDYHKQDFFQQSEQLKMKLNQELKNRAGKDENNSDRHHRHRHRRHTKSKIDNAEQEKKSKASQRRHSRSSLTCMLDSDEGADSPDQNNRCSVEAPKYQKDKSELQKDDQNLKSRSHVTQSNTPPASSSEMTRRERFDTDNNSNSSNDLGSLPCTLPRKQRELFLRIQQQQRKATESNSRNEKGEDDEKSTTMKKEEQEESWYSSDEEETSLTDVLKNLSKQEQEDKSSKQDQRLSTSPAAAVPITPSLDSIKLSEIDISETVSKLLSSIRSQQGTKLTNVISSNPETTDTRDVAQSVTSAEAASLQARDPRLLSRDPRNRGLSCGSSSVVSPHSYNPRTVQRSSSSDERNEAPHTSIYSADISPSIVQSTFDSGSDVDLRQFHTSQRHIIAGFETGVDMDLRQRLSSSAYGDTDLRTDVDLRGMLGLPFKPVPLHTPANEIEASLMSHPPIPYKLMLISIPRPDYSTLKLNMSETQARNDPRLRKLFKMSGTRDSSASSPISMATLKSSPSSVSRSDPRHHSAHATTSVLSSQSQEAPSLYQEVISQGNLNETLMHNKVMNRMMPSVFPGINIDPRLPRYPRSGLDGPGLLGPAPQNHDFCPSTPRY